MLKYLKFLAVGFFFGVLLVKSEIVSWYRIFEMFKFQSFHMYGIIGSAIALGMIGLLIMKKFKVKDINGNQISIPDKEHRFTGGLIGGAIFGLGWGLAGACPGPMYVLLGTGVLTIAIVLVGTIIGTFIYGILRPRLPH
jgi:uncharacterized membrane protein YedE/YeeE